MHISQSTSLPLPKSPPSQDEIISALDTIARAQRNGMLTVQNFLTGSGLDSAMIAPARVDEIGLVTVLSQEVATGKVQEKRCSLQDALALTNFFIGHGLDSGLPYRVRLLSGGGDPLLMLSTGDMKGGEKST